MSEFVAANRLNWDERVAGHLEAYRANEFADNPSRISSVVRQDYDVLRPHLPATGVAGLTLAHLQCHIGTDSLSWSRLGAEVTGIDFSPAAIDAARGLAARARLDACFVTSTIDGTAAAVTGTFDVVYTSVGVLVWLPRLDTWAATVRRLLAPGGIFFVRDGHPVLSALDPERTNGELVLGRPYFETDTPARYDDGTTYASDAVNPTHKTTFEWSHSLSEIIGSLLNAGLSIEAFHESTSIPWRALPMLEETPEGYVYPKDRAAVPLEFSIVARRKD